MGIEAFKKEGRRGYNSEQVDAFLLELNSKHISTLSEKDAELKRAYSELEEQKKENLRLFDEIKAKEDAFAREKDEQNARIGEKISAAEEAARAIVIKTESECTEKRRALDREIQRTVEQAKADASEYLENAKSIAAVYEQKQQLIFAGIEQARRHLNDVINAADTIIGKKNEKL